DGELDHPGIKVFDEHPVVFIVLGQQAEGVGLDAQVDVFADQDGLAFGLFLLNAESQGEDAVIHGIGAEYGVAVFGGLAGLEYNAQSSAIGQSDALAQAARAAQAIERARDTARVLAQLSGFAFEAINFLNDLDRQQNIILLEREQRVGIVEEDIGIKDVIFFHESMN